MAIKILALLIFAERLARTGRDYLSRMDACFEIVNRLNLGVRTEMIDAFKKPRFLHAADPAVRATREGATLFVDVPAGERLSFVGDLHGAHHIFQEVTQRLLGWSRVFLCGD
ncbi:MAG: hypothetical protein HQL23_09655, partial [Candidatus Omnitrophica bacterium]|nr:hypothetical protein [Candidatus Omnitrophota bacterium]